MEHKNYKQNKASTEKTNRTETHTENRSSFSSQNQAGSRRTGAYEDSRE